MAVVPAFATSNEMQPKDKGILVQQEITEEDLGNGYTVTRILEAYKPEIQKYDVDKEVTGYDTYVVKKAGKGVVLLLNFEADFVYNAADKTVNCTNHFGYTTVKRDDVILSADLGDYNYKLITLSTGIQKYTTSQYFMYTFVGSSSTTKKLVSISCDSTGKIS